MWLVLCRKEVGVWRDDLIVVDTLMKLASWQTRVSPALLTLIVSKMFIVRGGRCSRVIQADMEEFRTIRAAINKVCACVADVFIVRAGVWRVRLHVARARVCVCACACVGIEPV